MVQISDAVRINPLAELVEAGRFMEAKQRLRRLRCDLMEELHVCQRRVDLLDWLIRETERANIAEKQGLSEMSNVKGDRI